MISLVELANGSSRPLLSSHLYYEEVKQQAIKDKQHIYIIVKGPRVDVVSISETSKGWEIQTTFEEDKVSKSRVLKVPHNFFPNGRLHAANGVLHRTLGNEVVKYTAAEIARKIHQEWLLGRARHSEAWMKDTKKKFFTYEVMYVGQAYGDEGSRTAIDRLDSGHEKLQLALAEVNDYSRNSDIGIILVDSIPITRHWHGTIGRGNYKEVAEKLSDIVQNPFGPLGADKEVINAAEAMLIRYFDPGLNHVLKNFPTQKQRLVEVLRQAGIDRLAITLNVSNSYAMLFDPKTGGAHERHRFSLDLESGKQDVESDSPLAWRAKPQQVLPATWSFLDEVDLEVTRRRRASLLRNVPGS